MNDQITASSPFSLGQKIDMCVAALPARFRYIPDPEHPTDPMDGLLQGIREMAIVFSDSQRALEESAAREAAYGTAHCESEGCAHEYGYTKRAEEWVNKFYRYKAALRRIAITDDADCAVANDAKAMTRIAREALE